MNRRSLVRTVLAGTVAPLAGCSQFQRQGPSEVTISEFYIENKHNERHHIDAVLLHADTVVFFASAPVKPAQYDDDTLQRTTGRTRENVSPNEQTHTLYARVDEGDWLTTRFEPWGNGCVRIGVEISPQGDGVFEYSACPEDS